MRKHKRLILAFIVLLAVVCTLGIKSAYHPTTTAHASSNCPKHFIINNRESVNRFFSSGIHNLSNSDVDYGTNPGTCEGSLGYSGAGNDNGTRIYQLEHFEIGKVLYYYTTDQSERNTLRAGNYWIDTYDLGIPAPQGSSDAHPIYLFTNNRTGDRLYSTNSQEVSTGGSSDWQSPVVKFWLYNNQ